MENKTGVLELLCGPSGVGKTSSLKVIKRSYRIIDETSRPIRPGECVDVDGNKVDLEKIKEVISEKGIFESQFGIFVSAQEFDRRINEEFFVWYQTEGQRRYGFGEEIKQILELGFNCSEQISTYEVINTIADYFEIYFEVRKIFFFTSLEQVKRRLDFRSTSKKEFDSRFNSARETITKYLNGILAQEIIFDNYVYTTPKGLSSKESFDLLGQWIEKIENNKGFILDHNIIGERKLTFPEHMREYLDILIVLEILDNYLRKGEKPQIIKTELQCNSAKSQYLFKFVENLSSMTQERIEGLQKELLESISQKKVQKYKKQFVKYFKQLQSLCSSDLQTLTFYNVYNNPGYHVISREETVIWNMISNNVSNLKLFDLIALCKLYIDVFADKTNNSAAEFVNMFMDVITDIKKTNKVPDSGYISKIIDREVCQFLSKQNFEFRSYDESSDFFTQEFNLSSFMIKQYHERLRKGYYKGKNLTIKRRFSKFFYKGIVRIFSKFVTPDKALIVSCKLFDLRHQMFLMSLYCHQIKNQDNYNQKQRLLLLFRLSKIYKKVYDSCYKKASIFERFDEISSDFKKLSTFFYYQFEVIVASQKVNKKIYENFDFVIKSVELIDKMKKDPTAKIPILVLFKIYILHIYLIYVLTKDWRIVIKNINDLDKFRDQVCFYTENNELTDPLTIIFYNKFNTFLNVFYKLIMLNNTEGEYKLLNDVLELLSDECQDIVNKYDDILAFDLYFFMIWQFFNNIKKILMADPCEENSPENPWAYPCWCEPCEFLEEFFITDYPSAMESYEKIKQLVAEIKKIVVQKGE